MKSIAEKSTELIIQSYDVHRQQVCRYIYYRINDWADAEDLTQDVYLRLMDYKQLLCKDTVKEFVFTIARNLVIDYLRRYYKRQEVTSYIYDHTENATNDMESRIIADDLEACERRRMSLLPPQRGKIYQMSRYENKTVSDISEELNLSPRTVENHLFISRKEVREFMRKCI